MSDLSESTAPPSGDELLRQRAFLRALARGVLADEHLAEDVVQQAFLRALTRPPRESGALRAWLARVVRNLALNTVRARDRRVTREQAGAQADAQDADREAAEELGLQRLVAVAVDELPEPYRTAIHLRYFRGHPTTRIARMLAISPKTVEARLARAHARLRVRLARAWREETGGRTNAWLVLATLPGARPGWTWIGGAWMTKQGLLLALGGATLLGLVWTWNAAGSAPRAGEAEPERLALAPALAPVPELGAAPAPETRSAAEAPAPIAREEPPPEEPPPTELESALEQLSGILDHSLEGRLNPGAILDAALLVAEHEVGNALPDLDPGGRLLLPIEGLPEGVTAQLCVSGVNRSQQNVLTLQIELERPADEPYVFEDYRRGPPTVQLTTWTTSEGELQHFSILTDISPTRRAGGVLVDPPRFTHGVSLYTSLADPESWTMKGGGLLEVEGSLQPDGGRSYKTGSWELPRWIEGDPWPRTQDIRRLSARLLEMHAAARSRAER